MDESSNTQNRKSRRSNLLMAATIETSEGSIGVTLRNLSSEGALVEGDGMTGPGSQVVFRKNELCVSGRIAWVNDRRAGIAFDAKLRPETVLRHIPVPRLRIEPRVKRPPLSSHTLSPEEQRWCETLVWGRPISTIER
jgi:hypothetical protein